MRKFFKEFTDFIKKGNVLDLAVAIIIGGAFNTIVRSLVNDIIMPFIGLIGGTNVSEARVVLVDAVLDINGEIIKNAVTLNYGSFIQSIIDFLIIALSIFITLRIVKKIDSVKKGFIKSKGKVKEVVIEASLPKPTTEELLTDIRNLLSKKEEEI